MWRNGKVVECEPEDKGSRLAGVTVETFSHFLLSKKFDICESLSKNFDICTKIVFRDAEIFFRHKAELVLRHQMRVSNYFVKFFYSVYSHDRSAYSAAGKYVDQSWEYIKIAHRHMNVEIWTEAAQFLVWKYINGIFDAVLLFLLLAGLPVAEMFTLFSALTKS